MNDRTTGGPAARATLRDERERVIEHLSEAYARDHLDEDELERRLTLAHAATTLPELDALRADLPVLASSASTSSARPEAPRDSRAIVPRGNALVARKPRDHVISVFGNTRRAGPWTPPEHLVTTSVFGNVVLDFREASLPVGVTEVRVRSVFGNVEILLPPSLAVEMHGLAVFGSFESMERGDAEPDPERPLLRIHGTAVFGNVEAHTRLPGENGLDAWRRRRRERRDRRRE